MRTQRGMLSTLTIDLTGGEFTGKVQFVSECRVQHEMDHAPLQSLRRFLVRSQGAASLTFQAPID